MTDDELSLRKETIEMIARKIQDSGLQMPDIRNRSWKNIDSDTAKLFNLLIEAEDILIKLDEYQMENGQCYPEFEDFMLQIGDIRKRYTEFIDNNQETLNIKTK